MMAALVLCPHFSENRRSKQDARHNIAKSNQTYASTREKQPPSMHVSGKNNGGGKRIVGRKETTTE